MTSINKKNIALIEKKNQEKLRNLAMKKGVILKSPETVFLSNDTKLQLEMDFCKPIKFRDISLLLIITEVFIKLSDIPSDAGS